MEQKVYKARIVSRKQVAENTYEVEFELDENLQYRAGQYIWVILQKLLYEDPKGSRRAFSICSSPNQKYIAIVFRNSESGFKKTLLEMPLGSEVLIEGPFGSMNLPDDQKKPAVFLAGGVGIAPFLSLIRYASEEKKQQKIVLLYSNSSTKKAAYSDELLRLQNINPNLNVKQIIGRLDWDTINQIVTNDNDTVWYVIGPEKMVEGTAKLLYEHGVNDESLVFEEFHIDKVSLQTEKADGILETFELFKWQ